MERRADTQRFRVAPVKPQFVVAQVFANALARKVTDQALRQSMAENERLGTLCCQFAQPAGKLLPSRWAVREPLQNSLAQSSTIAPKL